MLEKLKLRYKELFQEKTLDGEYKKFFSPGRVNLIGEHTDYNGGNVFPCALSFGTYGIASLRNDKTVKLYSENFKEVGVIEFSIDDLKKNIEGNWGNYCKGVIKEFKNRGYNFDRGFQCVIGGDIPNGAGLSSSASLELLIGTIIKELYKIKIETIELVKIGQQAENDFIGVKCGIMDQFVIGMGKNHNAILLNCATLKYTYVPLILNEETIIIVNTNKKRGLSDSKYNERRNECEEGLKNLQKKLKIENLCDILPEEFEENKELINNDIIRKRVKHVVYENARTLEAVKFLKEGRLEEFGKLMNLSHESLRDDYEVTGKELDTLVESQWHQEGVLGARMTGAGFGGCTVALVKNENIETFIKNVHKEYYEKTGLKADFYMASIGSGSREV